MDFDIFEAEQKIYEEALARTEAGADEPYAELAKEYGKILKQLRRLTRLSDKTANELHEANLDLNDKVNYDALTKIYNRRFMDDSAKRILNSLSRYNAKLSILMLDIDLFKKYNDTYGHREGDVCLRKIAEAISGSLTRADDFAARYGGEEFIVVLPNTNEEGARFIAERILANIVALAIPHEKSDVADCVTISIGATSGDVKQGQSIDVYIKRADEALYASKHGGRNRYTFLGL